MKNLIILTVTLLISISVRGQKLFFIGEASYPCTESITLKSNSAFGSGGDLHVIFAKDGQTGLIVASVATITEVYIIGKLIIYLEA